MLFIGILQELAKLPDRISAIDSLDTEDFVLVHDLIGARVVEAAADLANEVVMAPDEFVSGGIHIWHFPFNHPVLDNLLEESGILPICQSLLGANRLLLSNFMFWVRDVDTSTVVETRFHRDYPDNSILISREHSEAIGVILYLSDVDFASGPTRYVLRAVADFVPLYPRWVESEDPTSNTLDEASTDLVCRAGGVLFHSLLGLHRASQPTRSGRRITMHLVLRRADAHWIGWTAWPRLADSERFRRSIGHLSPAMKALIGWPGDDWEGWRDPVASELMACRFGRQDDGRA